MTIPEIDGEVSGKVAYLETHNGRTLHKQWLIAALMADHDQIQGEDRDFAVCCARFTIEQRVDRYFRTTKQSEMEEPSDQLVLPGYERLQRRYICDRNGEQVIVRVHDLTDEEIDLKAAQHRQMGEGHRKHANELERFKSERLQPVLRVV